MTITASSFSILSLWFFLLRFHRRTARCLPVAFSFFAVRIWLKTKKLTQLTNVLDDCVLDAEMSLDKLRVLGEDLAEFFDFRDTVLSTEQDLRAVQLSIKDAAIRFDMIGDYILNLKSVVEQLRSLGGSLASLQKTRKLYEEQKQAGIPQESNGYAHGTWSLRSA